VVEAEEAENLPALQGIQVLDDVDAVLVPYLPALHEVHADLPVLLWNVPAGHSSHDGWAFKTVVYFPAAQV